MQSAQTSPTQAGRGVADWVVARLPLDAFGLNHH
jgi:hypothetical protein